MILKDLYQLYLEVGQAVSTDTRTIKGACIYFALKGANFDGNQFTQAAFDAGARWAVVDDPTLKERPKCIFVKDVLTTLQNLARYHRRQFHIPIIGITGSNGKTTTKEIIASVLKSHYQTHFTQGNLNNHIGVPLSLLQMPLDTEIAVVEMGANHQGEIDFLSRIAEPSHGLITNIGKAHLEGFGGIEGVKKGKSELYRFLEENGGTAFINKDEDFLEDLSANLKKRIFYFRSENPNLEEPAYETKLLRESPFLKLGFLDRASLLVEANTNLYGIHNFNNLMAGVCIGKYFKVPTGKIKYALEHYVPSNNRSQILEWEGHKVFLDAYNANPSSMEFAVRHLSDHLAPQSQKVAILGDMLELGADSEVEHKKLVKLANALPGIHQLILVGPHFSATAQSMNILHFQHVKDLKKWFFKQNWSPSVFLLKASRGIRLEDLLIKH